MRTSLTATSCRRQGDAQPIPTPPGVTGSHATIRACSCRSGRRSYAGSKDELSSRDHAYGGGSACSDGGRVVQSWWPVHFYMSRLVEWRETLCKLTTHIYTLRRIIICWRE